MPTVELFFGFLRTCGLDHEWSAESAIREIYHCSRWERWVSVGCWVLSVCGLCPSRHLNQEPRQSRNERGELEGFPLDDTVPDHASLSRKTFRSPLHRNGSTGSLISTNRFLTFELSGFMLGFFECQYPRCRLCCELPTWSWFFDLCILPLATIKSGTQEALKPGIGSLEDFH